MNATTRATFDELRDDFEKANPGRDPLTPPAQGLYDPSKEHDSCGVGFVADMKNRKSHDILEKGLQILINLDHRGAVGADPSLGDGCGVLTQIPHAFFAPECAKLGFDLPAQGHYAIGQFFMPRRSEARKQVQAIVEEVVAAEGLNLLGWRDVPVDNSELGERVKAVEPVMQQIFVGRPAELGSEDDFERRLYRRPQGRLQSRVRDRDAGDPGILPGLDVRPHHCLQGHGAGAAACAVLPRPVGPALRDRPSAGPSTVRDQHVSILASCAPVSDGRAQRRNQHAAGQRQLDGGASGERHLGTLRRRHLEAVADLL